MKKVCYNASYWRRSSVVEQRNHNPLVRGPNPFAATKNSNRVYPGFNFGIVAKDKDPRSDKIAVENKQSVVRNVAIWKGARCEAMGIYNPFAATKNSTPIYSGFNFWYWGFGNRHRGPTRRRKKVVNRK